MTADTPPPQPTTIQRLATAVYPSFAMLAGMQLDAFTPLQDGPLTAAQLATALSVKAEKLSPLLYALVTAELLTVEGERFANTAEAEQFLVRGKSTYMGGRHESFSDHWNAVLKTAESIRTGVPQAKHDFSTMSTEALASFLRGLHPATVATGRTLVSRYDFSSHHTLVDVGGGSGGAAIAMTEACPHIRATVIELPTVLPVTKRFIEEAGATERVQVMSVDVVNDALPETYDVAVLRALIQVLSPDNALQALRNIGAAINPAGRIYIVGRVLDNSRLTPVESLGINLVFLNIFDDGHAYTEDEHRDWLMSSGFEAVERIPLPNGMSLITARKPA